MRYAIGLTLTSKLDPDSVQDGIYLVDDYLRMRLLKFGSYLLKYHMPVFDSADDVVSYCRYLSMRCCTNDENKCVRFYPLKLDTKEFPYRLDQCDWKKRRDLGEFGQVTLRAYSFALKDNAGKYASGHGPDVADVTLGRAEGLIV